MMKTSSDIETKKDIMFGGAVATREFCFTPMDDEFAKDLGAKHDSDGPMDKTNESRHTVSSSRPRISKKRLKRKSMIASLLMKNINAMTALVQQRIAIKAKLVDPPGCSISEVMKDVRSLPGVESGYELFFFAATMLGEKKNRAMRPYMKTVERKVEWLMYMLQSSKKS